MFSEVSVQGELTPSKGRIILMLQMRLEKTTPAYFFV